MDGPHPLRLLLVDDNRDDRLLVERTLRKEFPLVEVREVACGPELDRAIESGDYDIVITDYNLKWSTGLDVLRAVKTARVEIPVIMFTGTGNEEIAVAAMKAGLDDYVLKSPGHYTRLPAALATALERAESSRRAAGVGVRLQSLLNRLSVGVFRSTQEGRLLEANLTFLRFLGFQSLEEAQAFTLDSLFVRPEQRRADLDRLRSGSEPDETHVQLRRPDGETIWVSLSETLTSEPGGDVVIDGLMEDITERRRSQEALRESEEQLQQSQKMEAIGRLAGGVAHDFNNLLTVISGYCGLMLEQLDPVDPLHRHVEEMSKAADRASSLTRQLLAFSRRQVTKPVALDLNAVVGDIHKMLLRLIGEDVELISIPNVGLGKTNADPGQIEQVLLNLAVNARDAMLRGGKLKIETANVDLDEAYAARHAGVKPGPFVMLAMTDTGIGMDAATQARIFEPFFTTKENGKGTGLGLSTVYGIVRQSGGEIAVESAPGKGTTFRIYLPRLDEAAIGEDASGFSGLAKPRRGTETILLVEDEDMLRNLVREMLKKNGYTVLEARHGGEALLHCERHTAAIALMLTDVVMPQMSGRELAERLAPLRPDMKVLFMSGYTEDAIVQHGILGSGVAILHKPFTLDTLSRTLRGILDAPAVEAASVPA